MSLSMRRTLTICCATIGLLALQLDARSESASACQDTVRRLNLALNEIAFEDLSSQKLTDEDVEIVDETLRELQKLGGNK